MHALKLAGSGFSPTHLLVIFCVPSKTSSIRTSAPIETFEFNFNSLSLVAWGHMWIRYCSQACWSPNGPCAASCLHLLIFVSTKPKISTFFFKHSAKHLPPIFSIVPSNTPNRAIPIEKMAPDVTPFAYTLTTICRNDCFPWTNRFLILGFIFGVVVIKGSRRWLYEDFM